MNDTDTVLNATVAPPAAEVSGRYSIPEMVLIAIVAGFLSLVTVVGNSMVMISFKIDKQLQTISNYFLFSLAVADLAIGLISMPLFTVSTILGYWPLGPHICDTWLALDYLASNASVLNLLIISFDRYFSVTRPLTYRAKRTTNRAAIMIGCAWGISLLLWPPWIYSWPYIEGERTVPDNECYIQFIETNHYITFGTAIAAFYVPVTVMCILYWRIWRETEKRQKDLPNLQAGKKDSSKRSNSRYDEAVDLEDWKRSRSESSTAPDDGEGGYLGRAGAPFTWRWLRAWCATWWNSSREEECVPDLEDTPSDMGYATPVSVETPLQSSVSRCTSLNVIRDPFSAVHTPTRHAHAHAGRLAARSVSSDSVYTILIRLPPDSASCDSTADQPSIKMIADDGSGAAAAAATGLGGAGAAGAVGAAGAAAGAGPPAATLTPLRGRAAAARADSAVGGDYSLSLHPAGAPSAFPSPAAARRPSHMPDIRIPLNAKIIPKQLAPGSKALLANAGPKLQQHPKKKKKTQEKKADKKAAKTLSAILLTFIITWTPYNILVLLKPLTACTGCIPEELWDFFYYLCYINSTINPVCYALCNASFRRTYVRILTCKWHNRNRCAMNRGFYN